jgi:hypothetical protein
MSNFLCDKCNHTFCSRQSLCYHVNKNVCVRKGKYICNFCGKELSSSSSLYRHKKNACNINRDNNVSKNYVKEGTEPVNVAQIYERLLELERENNTLKKEMNKMKDSSNTTNNNYNISNVNNGTINNIYLVGYGKEDMDRIDRSDLLNVFRTGFNLIQNILNITMYISQV